MSLPTAVRAFVPLVIGLALGGLGVTLFRDSLPGAAGSPEERANALEVELRHAQNRITALEATGPRHSGKTLADGARDIFDDIREGKEITPDDLFRATQPLFRDLSPLLDRMRVRAEEKTIDSRTGELARKYHLNASQEAALKQFFQQKAEDNAKAFSALLGQNGSTLDDLARASSELTPDQGLDAFMATILTGTDLTSFQQDRLTERAEQVQNEADMKVQRIDNIVKLDATQRDQLFGVMARASKNYDPSLVIEGSPTAPSSGTPSEALQTILRPEQQASLEVEKQRLRTEASKDMQAVGLKLPDHWNPLDNGLFD